MKEKENLNSIIYEEQFRIKGFFMNLLFSRVGVSVSIIAIFYMGLHVKTFVLITLLMYAYYKYENVKRHEVGNIWGIQAAGNFFKRKNSE